MFLLRGFLITVWLMIDCSSVIGFDCDTSDQVIWRSSGVISSSLIKGIPSNSGTYPKNINCIWNSELPVNKFITFKFKWLDVELANNCGNDAVEIYDSTDTYEKFCGGPDQPLPEALTISTNSPIYVSFTTDDLFEYRGFELEYHVTDKHPCSKSDGFFLCHNRICVTSNLICNNKDDCGDGTDEIECASNKLELPVKCGVPIIEPNESNDYDRIVGGKVAIPGSWPWQISMQNSYSHPSGHFCGGALINNLWIVTAAHCTTGIALSQLKVQLGSHRRFLKDPKEVSRNVSVMCSYPSFDKENLVDDIALLRLSSPVAYSSHIQPICLPAKGEKLSAKLMVHVTGWGRTEGSGGHDFLKQARIPIIDHDVCEKMPSLVPLTETKMCMGTEDGRNSPCFGDSGGPVVMKTKDTKQWHLFGVVSSGAWVCGITQEPNICTEVSPYVDWINQEIRNYEEGRPMHCQS